MVDINLVRQHRSRALNPDHPFMRGTAQNPDVYFQGRESVNSYYENVPQIVQACMDQFTGLTGRSYHLVDYYGDTQAERLIVVMGSALATLRSTVDNLQLR